jgi:sodium transport system ATP-binding protein
MIRAEGLGKEFTGPKGEPVVAVKNATLAVRAGEILGLLGPNGAGKTTLLRMLATIIKPSSGECWIAGQSAKVAAGKARRQIGFMSGNTRLYGRLKAREMLLYFGRLYGMSDQAIAQRTEELATTLDMKPFMEQRCDTLSTGQTQKVSIARVLLHDPPVLILDEPTLGLDIMTSTAILDFILDARSRQHSIIFSTHYMTEAELLCDRVGLMHSGEIMAVDTKQGLYDATGTKNLHDVFMAYVRRHAASQV